MADRAELVEAALDVYTEGLALLDEAGRVVFWNHTAEILTGHPGANIVGRELPQALEPLTSCSAFERSEPRQGLGTLVHAQHKWGHNLPAIARRIILRDSLGARIGSAIVFHLSAQAAALPHGGTGDRSEVQASQGELRDQLETEYECFAHEAGPLGILSITVDQADTMRSTHGAQACEAMLENMERALANHLRAGDEIGRWGNNEFLVVSREPGGEALADYAQVLAGTARTADFRWWGDRLSLTVSVGAAEAERGEPFAQVLTRARQAKEASANAGGNRVMLATESVACSPS
jgi:diguanylate cyclase (GGDEF)-like protein